MKKITTIFLIALFPFCIINLKAQIPGSINYRLIKKADNGCSSEIIYDETKPGLNYARFSQILGKRFNPNNFVNYKIKIEGIPISAIIIKAYLWDEGSANRTAQTATINGPAGTASYPMVIVGQGPDKCWGYKGKYTYRADVTSAIGGNGIYNISGVLTNPPTAGETTDGPTLIVVWQDPNSLSVNHIAIEQNSGSCDGYCNPNGEGCLAIKVIKDSGYAVRYSTIADDYSHAIPKVACELSDTLSEIYVYRGYYYVYEERYGKAYSGKNEIEFIDETKKTIRRKR